MIIVLKLKCDKAPLKWKVITNSGLEENQKLLYHKSWYRIIAKWDFCILKLYQR